MTAADDAGQGPADGATRGAAEARPQLPTHLPPEGDGLVVRPLAGTETGGVLAAALPLSRLDAQTLRSPNGTYLVAWAGAAPLGHAHVEASDPPELGDVHVLAAARGRGVGTALVAAACAHARSLGADRLRLTVSATNDGAAALYARLGFVDAGLPPRHVVGPIRIRSGVIDVDDVLLTLERPL